MMETTHQPFTPARADLQAVTKLKKFAVVSHILPPSPSGQSMVLSQLLRLFSPHQYVLISSEDYANLNAIRFEAFPELPAHTFLLDKPDVDAAQLMGFLRPVDPYRPLWTRRLMRPLWIVYGFIRRKIRELLAFWIIVRAYAWQIQQIVEESRCEGILACTGNLFDLPAAYLASRRCGVPFFVYVFDDYRYQYIGINRLLAVLAEARVLRGARGIITINPFLHHALQQRYGVASTVIHNSTTLPDLDALDHQDTMLDTHTTNIVYTGAVYQAQFDAFRNLIQAIYSLKRDDVRLHIFTSQAPEMLTENGVTGDFVIYHPHIEHEKVARVQREADVLFLPLAFRSPIRKLLVTSLPGKMSEYLSVGRPILAHVPPDTFVSWYFREHACGIVVDEDDPDALAQALDKLLRDPDQQHRIAERARIQAARDFEVSQAQVRFAEFLKIHLGTQKD